MARPTVELGHLSLRERERGFLAGGTQAGKSTLADELGADFLWRYRAKGARRLILDSKPRYRAKLLPTGMSAKRLYRRWDHGPEVPDSVVVSLDVCRSGKQMADDMLMAFSLGHRTVIAQGDGDSEADVRAMVMCAAAFLKDSRRGRPQLLAVDETGDYFHSNGSPIGDGTLVRVARAGAERGTSALYCAQMTRGINSQLMTHMDRLYRFRLDSTNDAKRFKEFGAPDMGNPTEPWQFRFWAKHDYGHVWPSAFGPCYQLQL